MARKWLGADKLRKLADTRIFRGGSRSGKPTCSKKIPDRVEADVLWLVLFSAHAVFHCFLRNLRPALRQAHTVIHFATLITADLLTGTWHPARAP